MKEYAIWKNKNMKEFKEDLSDKEGQKNDKEGIQIWDLERLIIHALEKWHLKCPCESKIIYKMHG